MCYVVDMRRNILIPMGQSKPGLENVFMPSRMAPIRSPDEKGIDNANVEESEKSM